MTLRCLCVLFLTLCAPLFCRANDAAAQGVGSSMELLKGEHRDIQMVRELVWIEVWGERYVTTVDFEFRNWGGAQNVKMGFPETGGGDNLSPWFNTHPGYLWFASWVDDQPVKTRRVIVNKAEDYGEYKALWVKTVAFKRGQTRRVRVRYEARAGGEASWFSEGGGRLVYYSFTGGNWRGQVRDSTLVAIFHNPKVSIKRIHFSESEPPPKVNGKAHKTVPTIQRRGRWMRYHWENWPAEGTWNATFTNPNLKPK